MNKNIDELRGSKPNILLILSDDHGYGDVSFRNLLDDVNTPNLDRLRKSGMLLEQGYVSAPVCSPTRSGLIVGSHHQRWGGKYFGDITFAPENYRTIPEILKTKGYKTGYFGKVHYGPDKPGSRSCPDQHGFDESFYGLAALGMGRLHYMTHEFNAVEKFGDLTHIYNMFPMYENGKEVECHNFLTYELADRAINFMNKTKKDPFFCMLAFNAVHNFTWQLPKEELEKRGLPEYEDYNSEEQEYFDWYDGVISPHLENGREYYLAQLELMDKKIGDILDSLEQSGQIENTLIVYLTDNGGSPCNFGNNSPLKGSKYTLYEGGIRVPFIASWKGLIKPNSLSLNLSSSLDLLETFAFLAGAEVPDENFSDGINLMPTLLGIEGGHDKLYFDTGFQYAIRDRKWKLISTVGQKAEEMRENLLKVEHADIGYGKSLFNISESLSEDESDNMIEKEKEIASELEEDFNKWKSKIENSLK